MKINLRVTFNDESVVEVEATARDLVAFEDRFNKPVTSLETDFRIGDMLWIAWHWLHRTGKTTKPFEEWCDDVDTIQDSQISPK